MMSLLFSMQLRFLRILTPESPEKATFCDRIQELKSFLHYSGSIYPVAVVSASLCDSVDFYPNTSYQLQG